MYEALKGLIRRFEGWRSKPYICPAGVPTIAYGATAYPDGRKVTMADPPMSKDEGERLLDHDAAAYARQALKLSPGLAGSEDRVSAIADFVYNLGAARYRASTLRKRVNEGAWGEAHRELQRWVFGGGRKLPGLVARRLAEGALLIRAAEAEKAAASAPKAAANANTPLTRAELADLLEGVQGSADPIGDLLAILRTRAA